ncbi:esterase [Streptomyces dioscori]|uniref:Esterase n=1 Tax=Streptomyces dioscori TaxID=2109333 RepID=A0A2P8PTW1_9ACTN|nr:alpha/beta hydrolase family protein [Streptomyces dioscori]PSM37408.1 esterase [Streptomyces dioscori]
MTRKRRCAALAVTTALLGTGVALTAPPTIAAPVSSAEAAAPVARTVAKAAATPTVVGERWLDARTVDLTIASPAVGASLPVRVVLPTGYAAQPDRTWPVLHLLQGAHDDYTSWTRETDVVDFLAGQDVLTVMPSSGPTGIPTDWWNYGSADAPDYETFQVDELMGVLQQRFRAGTKRAVAGVSTGGYGALAFAARHPGTFGAAASYSGILDTTALGMPTVLNAIVARELLLPLSLWGSYLLNRDNWNRHNPYALARALKGTGLYLSQGSGLPGGDFGNLEGALLEGTLWAQAHRFTAQLDALGIPAQVHFYSGGAHAWPNWRQEFKASWPTLAKGLGLS